MAKRTIKRIPVEFRTIGVNEETASIGIKIDRNEVTADDAIQYLCGQRLIGRLQAHKRDESPDQKTFTDAVVEGAFDATRISIGPSDMTSRLQFKLAGIDEKDLLSLRKRPGVIIVSAVESLTPDEAEEGEAEEEGEDETE